MMQLNSASGLLMASSKKVNWVGLRACVGHTPQMYGLLPSQLASFQLAPLRQVSVQSSLPVPSHWAAPACQSFGSPEAQFS